jgi:hypothetical protein
MEKVECKRCGRQVPKAPKCLFCGQALVAAAVSAMDGVEILQSTLARALSAHRDHVAREIARMTVFKSLPSGFFPGLKLVVVPPGKQAVVCADVREPIVLGPGAHSVARTGGPAGPLQGLLASIRGGFLTVCEIDATPFFASFVLPDLPTLKEYRLFDDHDRMQLQKGPEGYDPRVSFKAAFSSQNLRTADDLLGGAELQLRLRCVDPLRLQTNLVLAHEDFRSHEREEWSEAQKTERTWMLRRVLDGVSGWWARVRGNREAQENEELPSFAFNLHHVYSRLRAELEMAVRAAILNERVEELYNTVEVRDRVKRDVATAMAHSLDLYGIVIEDVVAFQFNCPDYEALRVQRGQTVIERGELDEQRGRRDLESERRKLTREDVTEAMSHEAQVERHGIVEEAATTETRDKAAADEEERLRARRAQEKEFERTQVASDARQHLQLTDERERQAQLRSTDKVKALLELQNQQQDAAMRRQIEWARTVADLGLTTESLLAVMLQNKPELAGVLIEMKKAAGLQQMLAMKDKFEGQFVQVLGQDRQQIGRLMDEAVRQFGTVMAKRAEAARPQIIPGGYLQVGPASPPPPPPPAADPPTPPSQSEGGGT